MLTACSKRRSLVCSCSHYGFLVVQERLNSLMVIHVHKDLTDKIDICDICNDFVSKGERRQVFGKFGKWLQ